ASQTSVISLPPELIQQSEPQPSVLPEQHGLTGLSHAEPSRLPRSPQPFQASPVPLSTSGGWSHEPVEWSPLGQSGTQGGIEHIPTRAAEYLRRQAVLEQVPEPGQAGEVDERPRKKGGMLLPMLVLILLVLGLLAALLSSFLLPTSASHGTGVRAAPPVVSAPTGALHSQMGG
ncbi:MAG TPA: hypothetical protein VF458_11140, partial [Ktedonobacteraceae bacterium]